MQGEEQGGSLRSSESATRGLASSSHTSVRILVSVIVADILAQFLLGMWLNLFASFTNMTSSISSMGGMMSSGMGMDNMMTAMSGSMTVLMVHMLNGYLLGILSIAVLAASLYSKKLSIASLGIAGFASILLAGVSGLSFMFSGFQNDVYSYLMAVGFILALSIYFAELYVSR